MKKASNLTWKQLKYFCSTLTDAELKKAVIWCGEEQGGNATSVSRVSEDYCQTDYGIEPASLQEYEEGEESHPIVWPKGTPILYVD